MASYEAVIGLEIHAQLKTASKLFCSCPNSFGARPNENVCEICSGMPGALPRLNKKAVELAAKAGMALNCTVNGCSLFSRKNYFYPDLPDGFQTSQFDPPICERGHLDVAHNDQTRRVGITRIHLENDAGKCIHGQGATLVDLNRAGTPLIEIVSEPDMRDAGEAAEFMRQVHAILVAIGATDGNMEEGGMRCDANVSLRPVGAKTFGVRTETKNLNSFRNIQKAIEYEIDRQAACLEDGEVIVQETRLFDAGKQVTLSMRSKENAHDYRYFPNPDLPPVLVSDEQLKVWRASLPELPVARAARLEADYGLSAPDAVSLAADKDLADYFEKAVAAVNLPRRILGLIQGELLRELAAVGTSPADSPFSPRRLAELAELIEKGSISQRMAHDIFPEIFSDNLAPGAYIAEKGLAQVSDAHELEALVDQALAENPAEVEGYRAGKKKLLSFFVGRIMAKTKGKANPALVNELLTQKLEKH